MPYINYQLITSIYSPPSHSSQCSNFSSMIKNKIKGCIWVQKYSKSNDYDFYDDEDFFYYRDYISKYDLTNEISKQSSIPSATIVNIYFYSKIYYEESKNYTLSFDKFERKYINCFNLFGEDNNIYYVYVDLSKDSVFNNINNTQKQEEYNKKQLQNQINGLNSTIYQLNSKNYENEKKINDLNAEKTNLSSNIKNLEKKYNDLQSSNSKEITNLTNENWKLQMKVEEEKNKLDNLTVQHNNLKKKQEEEENKKIEKKKNFENYKNTFSKDKAEIENKNIQESKSYINNFIINEFVKGFDLGENKKDSFIKKFSNNMSNFTKEFMKDCEPFIVSFKNNSQRIVQEYKVNQKIKIEHINFIVIGKAGIGKSAFINESLLLKGNQRAKEGKGTSVTEKSTLYCSEILKMVRMWDTQGLDYKITQAYILDEIKRLVEDGLKKGPDHYINIILYCTKGDRFQEEDGQLIHEIMKLYPMDNLPVIITQLQAYFYDDAIDMEKTIRKILQNYLENKIVEKIQITSIVSRDKIVGSTTYKARGITDLLRSSFDVMGRSVTSATFKRFLDDIEYLCKNFVDNKIYYLKQQSKDEMEVFAISKDYYTDDSDKYFEQEKKQKRVLNKYNFYNHKNENSYFIQNFEQVMTRKFIDIHNNLNNTHYSLEGNEHPVFLIVIKDRLKKLNENLKNYSKHIFENFIYNKLYQKYSNDLKMQQCKRSKQFNTTNHIIEDIEKNFKEKLLILFQNEFYRYFYCIIIKLFMDNLENILIEIYQKELKENEAMTKIINAKAENSLKFVTQQLKSKLLEDLEKYFPKEEKKETKNEFNDIKNNFKFDF